MKRIFAAWLMDIAKYVVTALVLSTVLADLVSGWIFYVVSLSLVTVIVLLGFILYKLAEKEEKEEKNKV